MRRAATWLSLSLATLLFTTVPAFATEGGEADTAADYFGSGQWDGMILAGIVGIIIGAVIVSVVAGGTNAGHGDADAQH